MTEPIPVPPVWQTLMVHTLIWFPCCPICESHHSYVASENLRLERALQLRWRELVRPRLQRREEGLGYR